MRISDWSSDMCSSDLRELDQKTSGEVERWRGRWAEMQNAALERANVPERVDHRSHQRRGIEQEATVHMGPSTTAMERRAEHQAMREGRAYEPVTMVGQHNAGVIEQRGLRQYKERGTEWLRAAGRRMSGRLHAFADTLSGAVDRDRRDAAEAKRQERLAAERTREQAQERQQAEDREKGEGRAHVELQSLMRNSYAVFCLKKKKNNKRHDKQNITIDKKHAQRIKQ